ncbi:hypothetical protein FUAX_10830 [Fulvitalea axinellae]|uniref:Carboxypeptidase regulatory-like domain-containing protein n=1 Tax=Fulvitalea axinellae TaxID=1182444 RepID=A0AAU9D717_9BACT|nr:hypothetical protein FUAX_10830 [Fulvitalea axinellae]
MKSKHLIFLAFLMVASCAKVIHDHGKQGVVGQVHDFSESKFGTQAKVCVYNLTDVNELGVGDFFETIPAELIKVAKVGENGNFKINLAPGRYSLFLKTPDGYMKGAVSSEGHVNEVRVKNNSFDSLTLSMPTRQGINM